MKAIIPEIKEPILDRANKLIFVQEYGAAHSLLSNACLRGEIGDDILSYLRLIELSGKLQNLSDLRVLFNDAYEKNYMTPPKYELLNLFWEIQNGSMMAEVIIEKLMLHMDMFGESAELFYGLGYCFETIGQLPRAQKNYEKAIQLNSKFVLSYFAISQLNYAQKNTEQGDYYFQIFEGESPFSLYGNYKTHRDISNEFYERGEFDLARRSIEILVDWWISQKNQCPPEIKLAEYLMELKLLRIQTESNSDTKNTRNDQIIREIEQITDMLIGQRISDSSTMLEIGIELGDYIDERLHVKLFAHIILHEVYPVEVIKKVAASLYSHRQYQLGVLVFELVKEAKPFWENFIRDDLYLFNLKLANKDVSKELMTKEYLQKVYQDPLLFQEMKIDEISVDHVQDAEQARLLAEISLKLNKPKIAEKFFEHMLFLNTSHLDNAFRYADYLLTKNQVQRAKEVISLVQSYMEIENFEWPTLDTYHRYLWLETRLALKQKRENDSKYYIQNLVQGEPWNKVVLIGYLAVSDQWNSEVFEKLIESKDLSQSLKQIDWREFRAQTKAYELSSRWEVAYVRKKIEWLNEVDKKVSQIDWYSLVNAGAMADPEKTLDEFFKLLNAKTEPYWLSMALSICFAHLGKKESALFWLQKTEIQARDFPSLRDLAQYHQAEVLIFLNQERPNHPDIQKAQSLLEGLLESHSTLAVELLSLLIYTKILKGQVQHAKAYLNQFAGLKPSTFEGYFLKGYLLYRDGNYQRAYSTWEHCLDAIPQNMRQVFFKKMLIESYEKAGEDLIKLGQML